MSRTAGGGRSKISLPGVSTVAGVTGISRRQQYSAATRRALLRAAEQLFAVRGYAATSLDAIVSEAKVTKGALYHHFSGKQGIFEAVLSDLEDQAARSITRAMKGAKDPWDQARAGLTAFLEVLREPAYSRLVVHEAPTVLGPQRFAEQQERSTFAVVRDVVSGVLSGDALGVDSQMQETFSRIFFGALAAAGDAIVESTDPSAATQRVEAAFGILLDGMRSLVGTTDRADGDEAVSGS
ncbi:TetR/AcrR family transcriptional regulator [Nocardioides jiangxiensis]|uniref:TetR/AcrR family transcriptional regulator n=1 Tax=Nocardioides jiangxiensis TaxID=3064524 RepID=A0ABT9B299_9ACTN|nr:TetR/AcrR family transcriptional regulator [Nocardioides sp. WY-20]MDO7868977.1 TetR/AcrR family transcriptional regulator [Nocardioides sp. WY-20]